MKKLLKSKMYLVGTLTMSIILFVSTGIQFWLTDYFINVLHFEQTSVNIAYAVVSITGPTSGCGFGGFIINRIGGYENPKTVYYVFLFASIGIGSAIFIPFVNNSDSFENWVMAAIPFAAFHACTYLYSNLRIVPNLIFWLTVAFILGYQYYELGW